MILIRESLLNFIQEKLGVELTAVDDETPLFSSGIIDSASMVDLIVFVESEGNIRFTPDEITLENLDSVDRILKFISSCHAE
ncbi:MAG TPA: acyl carrier protein [Candidatus Binatia bacterium]|jgi:acyl carrier protein